MKKLLVTVALSAILLSGCSLFSKNEGIIKVNDVVITQGEFDKAFDKAANASFLKAFGGADNIARSENNVMYVVIKEKVVNELIMKALIDSEIEKRGIKVTEEDIQEELKSVIDKVGSKEELNKILKSRKVSNAEFVEDLKTQIRIKKLISSIKKISISDAEAEKYYKANKAQFTHGEQVKASHILISSDTLTFIRETHKKNKNITPEELNKRVDKYTEEQKAKAEAILAEVKANPDRFEEIAEKKSEDKGSAERGGELGFFSKDDMVPEFSKAAFAMKPDTISNELVKTQYGYHIIKVTDRAAARTTPFVKVKDEIKYFLETTEQITTLKNLTSGLMKNAKVEYINSSFKPNQDVIQKALEQ